MRQRLGGDLLHSPVCGLLDLDGDVSEQVAACSTESGLLIEEESGLIGAVRGRDWLGGRLAAIEERGLLLPAEVGESSLMLVGLLTGPLF